MTIHNIPPVYDNNSKILILGSFPSPKSRETGFFYNNPQNRLWQVLSTILKENIPTSNEEKKQLLIKHNIAMWDVIMSCDIVGASDSSIKNVKYCDIDKILNSCNINAIFTLGDKAYTLFNRGFPQVKEKVIKLPSPSPANASFSVDKLVKEYSVIKNYLEIKNDYKSK